MNERFVCIKVDREERPDVDAIYMDAVVALTGQGGWPMTVFVTPTGEPFFGGTYFPPEPRHGLPSFTQVLLAVSDAWHERRDDVLGTSANLTEHIRAGSRLQPSPDELGAGPARARRREPAGGLRPGVGRVRPRPEVPAGVCPRSAAAHR